MDFFYGPGQERWWNTIGLHRGYTGHEMLDNSPSMSCRPRRQT